MHVFKFVSKDFKSPGDYGTIKYEFDVPVEIEDCDPPEIGQCGRGIHVLPISENVDFENCVCSNKCIWGEIDESDIIWSDNNKKMRVKKFTPRGELNRETKEFWEVLIKNFEWAYNYALHVDKQPRDDTRSAILSDPEWAFFYAHDIDKCPRDDTRNAVSHNPKWAYFYAILVDECFRDDTRKATLDDPEWAYFYALNIDRCPKDDTRNAALGDPKLAYFYALNIDKCPRDDTRQATLSDPKWAKKYEKKFPQ